MAVVARQNIKTHELLRDTLSEDEPSFKHKPHEGSPHEDSPSMPQSASSDLTPQSKHNPHEERKLATEILGALATILGAEPPKTKPSSPKVVRESTKPKDPSR